MTWKEFKDLVEQQGLKDSDELSYIEWFWDPKNKLRVIKYDDENMLLKEPIIWAIING